MRELLTICCAFIVARANNALATLDDLPFSDHSIAARNDPAPGGYARRLQLVSKGKLVDSGQVKPGHYAIVDGDDATDIGDKVDVIPLAVLDKALDTSGEDVVVAFGRENPVYQEIFEASKERDSGCMVGPVFLVFERSTGQFFEYFANNKSAVSEAKKIYPFLPVSKAAAKAHGIEPQAPRPLNLSSKYIEKKKYSWFAPVAKASTATFDNPPSKEALLGAINNFLKQAEVEEESRER